VATFHAVHTRNPYHPLVRPWFRFLIGRVQARIAVSPAARDDAARHFPGRYAVIPNGVDVERFRNSALIRERGARLLFVGRYGEPRKGLVTLLRALAIAQRSAPDLTLTIAGPGDPGAFAAELSACRPGSVAFAGYVGEEELPRVYEASDVVCVPSAGGESFGIVLLEAMAAGRPVVASDIPGYAGVIGHDRNGLLVPPGDPEAWAGALIGLARDRARRARLAEAGMATAEAHAWPAVARRIVEVYEAALSERRRLAAAPVRVRARQEEAP
jgi:phosphatidylinositol alpha-mannosyltransferase